MEKNVKKIRGPRATPAQHAALLAFLEKEKGLAEGKFASQHGREETRKKWCEIADELNQIPGAVKSAEQWQIVWRDIKSKTSNKFRTLRSQQIATGNRPITLSHLTEYEQRVVDLTGWEYMKGNDGCPDSLDIQTETSPICLTSDSTEVENTNSQEMNSNLNDDCVIANVLETSTTEQPSSGKENKKRVGTPLPAQPTNKRMRRDHTVRDDFLKIAKTQADALMVLANAQKDHARANILIAESLSHLTEILAFNKRIEEKLADIKKNNSA